MSFKETLLLELQKEAPGIERRNRRRRMATWTAAVTGGAGVLAAAVGVPTVTAPPAERHAQAAARPAVRNAAYTITEHGSTVEVKWVRGEQTRADKFSFRQYLRHLDADLEKFGVRADVAVPAPGHECRMSPTALVPLTPDKNATIRATQGGGLVIDTRTVPPSAHLTLLVTFTKKGRPYVAEWGMWKSKTAIDCR